MFNIVHMSTVQNVEMSRDFLTTELELELVNKLNFKVFRRHLVSSNQTEKERLVDLYEFQDIISFKRLTEFRKYMRLGDFSYL